MTIRYRLGRLEAHSAESERRPDERPGPLTLDERRERLIAGLQEIADTIAAEARGPRGARAHAPEPWLRAFAARVERDCGVWMVELGIAAGAEHGAEGWRWFRGMVVTWRDPRDLARGGRYFADDGEWLGARLRALAAPMRRAPDPARASIPEMLAWYDYGGEGCKWALPPRSWYSGAPEH